MDRIFKGFIACSGGFGPNGKKNLIPTKPDYLVNPDPFDRVESCDSYAGVIADGVVLIDIDDADEGKLVLDMVEELRLKTIVYRTTRGYHFYFHSKVKGNVTAHPTPIGVTVDTKVGGKGIAYLKISGEEREKVYDNGVGDLPAWLAPNASLSKTFGMGDGAGRNSALFRNIMVLKEAGWDFEDIKELYAVVNQRALATPLSDKELAMVLRPEAYDKAPAGRDSGRMSYDQVLDLCDLYMETYLPRKSDEVLRIYDGSKWVGGDKTLRRYMIDMDRRISASQREEVMKRIDDLVPYEPYEPEDHYIWLVNGIFDVNKMELIPHTPDIFLTNSLEHEWNPDAYCPVVDKFLDDISDNDGEVRSVLEEVIGMCLSPSMKFQKAVFILGDQSNGKSTFLNMLSKFFGRANVSNTGIAQLVERFGAFSLHDKMVAIMTDVTDDFLKDLSIWRALTVGDPISVEAKGKDAFDMWSRCKQICSVNTMPSFSDPTGANARRILIIPFEREFTEEERDLGLADKLDTREGYEYLLRLGVDGLRRLWDNQGFTKSDPIDVATAWNEFDSSHMNAFLNVTSSESIINRSIDDVYGAYNYWASNNNYRPYGRKAFVSAVRRTLKLVRVREDKIEYFREKTA